MAGICAAKCIGIAQADQRWSINNQNWLVFSALHDQNRISATIAA